MTAWLPESHLTREFAEGTQVRAGTSRWEIPVEVRVIRSRDPAPELVEEFLEVLPPGGETTDWG